MPIKIWQEVSDLPAVFASGSRHKFMQCTDLVRCFFAVRHFGVAASVSAQR
jgi:hypothetical protein